MDPLSVIVTCPALAAWSAPNGAEAEGREVVRVPEALARVAASALFTEKKKSINTPTNRKNRV